MNHYIKFTVIGYLCILFLSIGCQSSVKKKDTQITSVTNWDKLGPGGGGATLIPTFSYSSPDNFLVKSDMSGSYLTKNGGTSYQQINLINSASAYAYDPKNTNIIYIGGSFLSRSMDGGKTWEQIFPSKFDKRHGEFMGDGANWHIKNASSLYNKKYSRIGTIRVDPVHSGSVYFSMGPLLFYTSDYGKTWKRKDMHQHINYLYTNSNSAKNKVYIFTQNSRYILNKSSYTTISHTEIPKSMSPAFSFTGGTVANSNKIIFYALHNKNAKNGNIRGNFQFGQTEVWRSDDEGDTWKRIRNPIITNDTAGILPSISSVSCAEFDANQAYFVTDRYEGKRNNKKVAWYGAIKTTDAGKSWKWVWKGGGGSVQYGVKDGIVGVTNLKDAWVTKAFGGEYNGLVDIGVYPFGNTAVLTGWYRTMKTMDGGKTWKEIYSKEQPDSTFTSTGLDVTTSYGVHFDPFDSNHIAISYTDIGYWQSYNRGRSWERSVKGVPKEWLNTNYWVVFDPDVKNKVWSAWSSMHDIPRKKMTRSPTWKETAPQNVKTRGGVCVSIDGGKTWDRSSEGMGINSPTTCIILDPKSTPGNRTLYATVYSKGVFKSTDDGKTWSLKNNGIGKNTAAFELTLANNGNLFLVVSPTPMFKNGEKGRDFYPGAVYKSTDGAETWTKLNVSKGMLYPNGISVDPKDPNIVYLACWSDIKLSDLVGSDVVKSTGGDKPLNFTGGIFRSEDGGITWKSIFDTSQYVYDVTVDASHPGRVYCNTFNKAAYRSDDYGNTWRQIKGYDFEHGQRVIVDRNDPEKVYLTTFGSSVWHGVPEVEK